MNSGLRILLEDEHCLAVVKPAGQFVQGVWAPPGEQTLEQAVRAYLDPRDPASVYLGIVHRLDRPVSGVLIWAKTAKAARRLSMQFERRGVLKEYWAIVETNGTPQDEKGTWTDWLTAAGVSGVVKSVAAGSAGAREALTRFQFCHARQLPAGLCWLRLWPETGRTHQLRVQSAVRGMPILGDAPYGSLTSFPQGIALHARTLHVRHPMLHTPLELTAPLPTCWAELGIILGPEVLG
jgi:23S rRNA pseudouridine1911/1915/1917 synthase